MNQNEGERLEEEYHKELMSIKFHTGDGMTM